ncbi:hypothetical protein [Dactylococcopsis salina]|uniref:Uncharacterized protein n=1 Tax=Dactylococcopsis salina (strain PCC 8305) TaxID=13035 RepID=K9YUP7_DACS8|nr:hypothetical protein [Dactylococcopsis salina]AFZ50651.1 hypothetical protein Dacsa_2006 [Dactylococcopsis salina PCC 8305]
MLLPETEVQPALEQAQRAFPNFTNWNYINQANRDYFGFTMWGELTIEPDETMPRYFFITIDAPENQWRATLTIGQHSYLWSSADVGDAHLLATDYCDSLEAAISQLKAEIERLFQAILGSFKN